MAARLTLKRAKSSDELSPFILRNVVGLDDGGVEGSGAYGIVIKVTVNGAQCIAKRLHSIFLDQLDSKSKANMQEKFRNECILLSKLKHPNVVHFLGVHYSRSKDLTLIMEQLHTDLARFVESTPNLALSMKASMLLDVTYGLLYLHGLDPPVIHRDLTAPNILLTSDLRAKIADLGVAKLMDPTTQSRIFHTQTPGTQNYMPPEALMQNPSYSSKLDVFSFGHLSLYTINQKFPDVFHVEVSTQMIKSGIIELMKRQEALLQMGKAHPLYTVVEQCLSDKPEKRPTTAELHSHMQNLCGKYPKNLMSVPQALGFSVDDLSKELRLINEKLAEKSKKIDELQKELVSAERLKNDTLDQVDAFKHQAAVYAADFKEERKDRERAHALIEDLEKMKDNLTKQNTDRLIENTNLKEQLKTALIPPWASQDEQQDIHRQTDKVSQCLLLKEEGNALYKAGENHKAADKYHEALIYLEKLLTNVQPHSEAWNKFMGTKVLVLLNFSQCKLLFHEYNEVITHTTSVLEYDPNNVKALFRRGRAYAALCNTGEAKADFEEVVRLDSKLEHSVEKELANMHTKIREKKAQEERCHPIFSNAIKSNPELSSKY